MGNETIMEPPSSGRNRTVTVEYLAELQGRANLATLLERYLADTGLEAAASRYLRMLARQGDPLALSHLESA